MKKVAVNSSPNLKLLLSYVIDRMETLSYEVSCGEVLAYYAVDRTETLSEDSVPKLTRDMAMRPIDSVDHDRIIS
jgi:hypothetical protein